jgi:UPF0176 protein
VAGSRKGIDKLLDHLRSDLRFSDLSHKRSYVTEMPFYRMKVRLKKEIVSMGISEVEPGKLTGIRVDPKDWNALISDPEILVIDTRNQYEHEIGTFRISDSMAETAACPPPTSLVLFCPAKKAL